MAIPHPFRVVADLRDTTGYLVVAAPYAGPIVGKTKTVREQRIAIYDCGKKVETASVTDARLLSVAAVLRFKHPEIFALIYALMFDRGLFTAVVAPATVRHTPPDQLQTQRVYDATDDTPIQCALQDACTTALIHDAWLPDVRYFADWEEGADWRFSTIQPFKEAPAPSLPGHVWDSLYALDILFKLGACRNGNRLEVPVHDWPRAAWVMPLAARLS
jgi:hypothetical protein